jgi:hypothetical protein
MACARRNRRTYVGGRFCVGRETIMKTAKKLVAEASTGLQTLSAEDCAEADG